VSFHATSHESSDSNKSEENFAQQVSLSRDFARELRQQQEWGELGKCLYHATSHESSDSNKSEEKFDQ
jgi:hypothetical protein